MPWKVYCVFIFNFTMATKTYNKIVRIDANLTNHSTDSSGEWLDKYSSFLRVTSVLDTFAVGLHVFWNSSPLRKESNKIMNRFLTGILLVLIGKFDIVLSLWLMRFWRKQSFWELRRGRLAWMPTGLNVLNVILWSYYLLSLFDFLSIPINI